MVEVVEFGVLYVHHSIRGLKRREWVVGRQVLLVHLGHRVHLARQRSSLRMYPWRYCWAKCRDRQWPMMGQEERGDYYPKLRGCDSVSLFPDTVNWRYFGGRAPRWKLSGDGHEKDHWARRGQSHPSRQHRHPRRSSSRWKVPTVSNRRRGWLTCWGAGLGAPARAIAADPATKSG